MVLTPFYSAYWPFVYVCLSLSFLSLVRDLSNFTGLLKVLAFDVIDFLIGFLSLVSVSLIFAFRLYYFVSSASFGFILLLFPQFLRVGA